MRGEMLKGHLDLLLLAALRGRPAHGYAIVERLRARSSGAFDLPEGTIYPALHRLENRGWIASFWGTSENNRKAKYYRLTPTGRKQLAAQTSRWEEVVRAIGRILNPAPERKK